jgi:hypothetical protein
VTVSGPAADGKMMMVKDGVGELIDVGFFAFKLSILALTPYTTTQDRGYESRVRLELYQPCCPLVSTVIDSSSQAIC